MPTLYIQTQTPLDLREIFTLGLTSKQGENKIGHKGSGLKFTLALLHRLGTCLEIKTPSFHVISSIQPITIRDKDHEMIVLLDTISNQTIETHITKSAGIDTWTEPWFAIRELVQNAIDENGYFGLEYKEGYTTTCSVELTPPLVDAYNSLSSWYAPRNPAIIGQGNAYFYHGFKVYQSDKLSRSYDLTTILERSDISEDRQLRNTDERKIFQGVANKASFTDDIYEAMIKCEHHDMIELTYACYMVANQDEPSWNQENNGFSMEKLVATWFKMHGPNAAYTTDTIDEATAYYCRGLGITPVQINYRLKSLFHYTNKIKSVVDALPSIDKRVKKAAEVKPEHSSMLRAAIKLVKKVCKDRYGRPLNITVEVVEKLCESDDSLNVRAIADIKEKKISILSTTIESSTLFELVNTLVHEIAHIRSGGGDCSESFENELCIMVTEQLTRSKGTGRSSKVNQFTI